MWLCAVAWIVWLCCVVGACVVGWMCACVWLFECVCWRVVGKVRDCLCGVLCVCSACCDVWMGVLVRVCVGVAMCVLRVV